MAYSVVRNRARSEELAQDAFLIAWCHRERVPVVTPGWICAIARNLARNAARRRVEVAMDTEPMAEARDARDELIDRETEARALEALAQLPERYREAVVLYYRGEQSIHDVAAALGVSEATARQRVHRGRTKLRDALQPVVATLGATRPGVAFTTMCVAAFLAGGAASAQANGDVLPSSVVSASWFIPAIASAVASVTILVGLAVTYSAEPTYRVDAPSVTGSAARTRARFPAFAIKRPVPKGFTAVSNGPQAIGATVDLDFSEAPIHDMMRLLAFELDAPIWLDPEIEARVNIHGKHMPVMDVFDELLAQVAAMRTEVEALKLVTFGGRTDASQFGGDPISLQLRDAPLHDVLSMIEAQLHMPIGRLALPDPPPCTPGILKIEGRDVNVQCGTPMNDPSPRVTIDVRDMPAGAVLERVLVQTHLGFEITTGFVVTPDPG